MRTVDGLFVFSSYYYICLVIIIMCLVLTVSLNELFYGIYDVIFMKYRAIDTFLLT